MQPHLQMECTPTCRCGEEGSSSAGFILGELERVGVRMEGVCCSLEAHLRSVRWQKRLIGSCIALQRLHLLVVGEAGSHRTLLAHVA